MNKRYLKGLLLALLFGIPLGWYLFLQVFGTNQFELESLGIIDSSCLPSLPAVVLLRTPTSIAEQNQVARLEQNPFTVDYFMQGQSFIACFDREYDIVFVDKKAEMRGVYELNMVDIDRLITEVELYKEIESANGNR